MGTPRKIDPKTNRWHYGHSTITFNEDGIVIDYYNSKDKLKIKKNEEVKDSEVIENTEEINYSEEIGKDTEQLDYITLGSSKEDVSRVMGVASSIYDSNWSYEFSIIRFDINGLVSGWNDISDNLIVYIGDKIDGAEPFTIGSTKNEVIAAMGTPSSLYQNRWEYEYSSITFDNDDLVSGWSDISKNLKNYIGDKVDGAQPFTIGSTKEQVIAAMGTPSSLNWNRWEYEYSSVTFDDDNLVSGWSNISGNLNVK
ncbi:outer membrane protein assembly factor BamE [Clostridium sp. NSJ-145]|uniref:outer membrane protein assembly factor BamE n=1 Tax=Clostridium sp. NSJ-145 TaxID=2897777 RepID=UPI001E4F0965|nr:outer membrane protein assembly factor BamE [Clostridium sp. NSJ-145]MCD2503338.1 outer membrane protein assembly factor BamE [Clostridium sp. NSJ-145]